MRIETIILACVLATNLLLLAGVAYYSVGAKRWLWSEMAKLRQQQERTQHQLVAARKEIILNAVGDTLRLPALMPSQSGEDVLIYKFFGGRRTGFYVEVGAYDGVGFSNTYFLDALGWDGILVEPAPDQAEACRRSRPHSRVVRAACGRGGDRVRLKIAKGEGIGTLSYIGNDPDHERRIAREGGTIEEIEVPQLTLDEIVGQRNSKIGLLSIDVEGAELQVLESADLMALSPELIVIEDNTQGADRRVENLLGAVGYRKDFIWTHNVFYVKASDSRHVGW
jgi:FkbM family methyltransferase